MWHLNMAAVRDTTEAVCALRCAEATLGLHSAEDGFFHVLSPGSHALVPSSLKRPGDVPLPTNEQGEAFHIEIVVRRARLILLLEEGRCCVDGMEVAKGGNPIELKLGSTLEVGGSRFTLTTRAAVASSSGPRVRRRKRRCLPTPPTGLSPKETATDQSLAEADPSMPALVRAVKSDVHRLRNTSLGQLTIKRPYVALATNLVSHQMLLQPNAPGHAPLLGRLKGTLARVEALNQSLLRDFIVAFHTALLTPVSPAGKLPPDTPTVDFLLQLVAMGTTAKELELDAVAFCGTLLEVLSVFSSSPHNQQSLLEGGAVRWVIQCMNHPVLREEAWLVECGWGILTDLVHIQPNGSAVSPEQVRVLVGLMQQQVESMGSSLPVMKKMAAFMKSLAEQSAKVQSECTSPEVGGAAQALQVVLPQLKTLPETVRADPTFSHAYFSAVHLLAPVSGLRKLPHQQLGEQPRSGEEKEKSTSSPSDRRRIPPNPGPTLSPQPRKLPLPPTRRNSKIGPVAVVASAGPPRRSSIGSSNGSSIQGQKGVLLAAPCREDSQAPVEEVMNNGRSRSIDCHSLSSSGVGVRGVIARHLPSLDINSLLGQHKGVGVGLPSIKRSSPYYYPTLSLRRSRPSQAELREMLAQRTDSSSEEEEEDSPDVAPPPYTERQGGDGSDLQGSENVCPPQTVDPTHTGGWAVPRPKRTSWDPVLPSDELFPFRHQKSAVLSEEQQAVEEIQTGHRDVICTLRAREQLIPNVCRLWNQDKALQAVTNTLQMCLTENEEDIALLMGVLGVFMEIPGPWRLSVCAVLLPTLQKLVLGQLDKMYVLAACRVVEMIVDRFSPLILTCKTRPPGPRATLAATSDYESKEICFSELSKMAAVLAQQLARQQEPALRAALEQLQAKLDPFLAGA